MRQIRFTLEDFIGNSDSAIPDAVLSEQDLNNIRVLAGLRPLTTKEPVVKEQIMNMTHTAQVRADYMRTHNIQPGTEDWFRLWFSRPYLTGDTGMGKNESS